MSDVDDIKYFPSLLPLDGFLFFIPTYATDVTAVSLPYVVPCFVSLLLVILLCVRLSLSLPFVCTGIGS